MTEQRLPAEWEPQSGIMLTWPLADTDWGQTLTSVESVFVSICAHTSPHEKVLIVAKDSTHQAHITSCITPLNPQLDNIIFAYANSDDSWARDHGPITVVDPNNNPLLLDFQFNGWGEKHPHRLDNEINKELFSQNIFSAPNRSIDFILEGGSIESDGKGTLLTTGCLLSERRNSGWSQDEIELELTRQLGLKQIHWLHHGHLIGDDTDAHIDTLARFVSPEKIAYVKCEDSSDVHYQSLLDMEKELIQLKTIAGKPYELVPLPFPQAIFNDSGERLPATYANFLIINHGVLLPVYGQSTDQQAIDVLGSCFPGREIISINCLPLIEQFGSLHCVTMQFPTKVHINGE